jgi:TIR domain-containing protein
MADIFVSYKREDRDAVAPLARILEAQGWSVWWDPAIVPGERYQAVIDLALNEAKCVIVVWSPQSTGSHWVLDEAGKGRDRGILVPVLIDGANPPLGFGQYQAVDLAKWSGRPDDPRLGQLFAGVLRVLSGKPPAQHRSTSAPSHAPQASRRRAGNI